MPGPNRRPNPSPDHPPPGTLLALLAERPQLDFEFEFYEAVLARLPDFAEVLRAQASNLTLKGLLKEGLKVDQKLVQLRPRDPTAHYNLACRYALLKQRDMALTTLRRAVELGYRDFRYMLQDQDLDSIRKDPRFKQLLREYGGR
jgi:tetratricopeptide (TPR) repeat protein